jgi:hypothetical protein
MVVKKQPIFRTQLIAMRNQSTISAFFLFLLFFFLDEEFITSLFDQVNLMQVPVDEPFEGNDHFKIPPF